MVGCDREVADFEKISSAFGLIGAYFARFRECMVSKQDQHRHNMNLSSMFDFLSYAQRWPASDAWQLLS
jgi:hypothetical protein